MKKYTLSITTIDGHKHTTEIELKEMTGAREVFLESLMRKKCFVEGGLAINMSQVIRVRLQEKDFE